MPNEKLSEINEHDAEELIHYPQDEEQKERRSRLLPGAGPPGAEKQRSGPGRRRVAEKTSEDHAYLMLGAVPFWLWAPPPCRTALSCARCSLS